MKPSILIYSSVPNEWYVVLDHLVEVAQTAASNIAPGFLAVVGIAALMLMIFTLFRTAEESFNRVWGIVKRRGFIHRYTAYIIVAVCVPVLSLGAIALTSDILSMMGLENDMSSLLSHILSLTLASIACALVYKYLPYTRVRWRMAFTSGFFAGVLLCIFPVADDLLQYHLWWFGIHSALYHLGADIVEYPTYGM